MLKLIQSPFFIIDVISLITAILLLKKEKAGFWKLNIVYLLLVLLTESIGTLLRKNGYRNDWLYNVFILFEASFVSYGFFNLLSSYVKGRWIFVTAFLVIIFVYLVESFTKGFYHFNQVTTSVMTVIFILYGLLYYYFLLKDPHYIEIRYHSPFWWVTGSVLFYFGSIASDLFFIFFKVPMLQRFPLRYFIYILFNCILYGLWMYSYLCRYRQTKPASS